MSRPADLQAASPDIPDFLTRYFAMTAQIVTLYPGNTCARNLGAVSDESRDVMTHLPERLQTAIWAILVASFTLIQSVYAQPAALQWSQANSSGTVPSPRIDAPVAYDSVGRQLLMFGGLDASGDRNDLWAYSVDNQQWTQINPSGPAPNPRHGHTVTFDPVRRRVIVIAGQGAGFFSDAWAYDIQGNSWTQLSGNSNGPTPRYGLSAIYDPKRDRIVISHGFTSDGRFDDTWALDLKSNSWRDISPSNTRPLRRCLHHAVYVPQSDQMLLYGGCSSGFGPCPQGDLWSFDLVTNQWKQIVTAVSPAPRQRYGMVFDDHRNKMVLFGGLGGPPFNDTWEYDPASAVWTQIATGGDVPTARYRLEAVFASDLGTAFFFGGQVTAYTNDLLLLSVATSTGPRIAAGGFEDVFSGAGGPFAPGEIVAIYGASLGPATGLSSAFDPATTALPNIFGGVSVAVNGVPAPPYYVSAGQVNVQIPYEVAGQSQASVSVSYNGTGSAAQLIQIAASTPRLYPGVFNADGSLNSAENPAPANSIVTLFATGHGVTNPPSFTGKAAAEPYSQPAAPVRVSIGGQDGEILFAGSAPETAGVLQINVRLPAGITGNTIGVLLTIGDATSQNGVAVVVR
jgi:uncharacterized protein (TIGR03437 family)